MTLNNIADSLGSSLLATTFGQTERTRASSLAGSDGISKAFEATSRRNAQERSSTEVRLSSLGQLRSSIDQLRESSKTLAANESTNTPAEARAIAQRFVDTYNNAQATAESITDLESGDRVDNDPTSVLVSQFSKTIDSTSQEQLRQVGITPNQDGTLSIDQQRFQQALQNNPQQVSGVLANMGLQVQDSTSQQLNGSSQSSRAINTQTSTTDELQTQQQQVEQQASDQGERGAQARAQPTNENVTDRINAVAAAGIATYQRIFSL